MGKDNIDNADIEKAENPIPSNHSKDILCGLLPFLESINIDDISVFCKRLACFKNAVIMAKPEDRQFKARNFRGLCRIGINIFDSKNEWASVQEIIDYYDDWSPLIKEAASGKKSDDLLPENLAIAEDEFNLFLATPSDIDDMKSVASELKHQAATIADVTSVAAKEDDAVNILVLQTQERVKKKTESPVTAPVRLKAEIGRMTDTRSFPIKGRRLRTAAIFGKYLSSEHLCKEQGVETEDNLRELCEGLRKK